MGICFALLSIVESTTAFAQMADTSTRNLNLSAQAQSAGEALGLSSAPATTENFVPLVPGLFNALGIQGKSPTTALPTLLQGLFRITVGVGAVLAVIMVAVGGIEYMTTDSSFKIGNARARITDALFGLAIILLCVVVFNLINNRLTNLDILTLKSQPGVERK